MLTPLIRGHKINLSLKRTNSADLHSGCSSSKRYPGSVSASGPEGTNKEKRRGGEKRWSEQSGLGWARGRQLIADLLVQKDGNDFELKKACEH